MSKLWAGRFESELAFPVLDFISTTDIDTRLIESDIWVNLAHVMMLSHQNIIPQHEGRAIIDCLLHLLEDAQHGKIDLDKNFEDVHLNIEQVLISRLGIEIGGKINTARSRNDQVVADTRLYLRQTLLEIQKELIRFVETLIQEAENSIDKVMIGYTHGQSAQPISLAYWFTSYASVFNRDILRIYRAYEDTNLNPLGACALAGTSFPINRKLTTEMLGFKDIILHGLDATSSRDFIVEAIATLAIITSNFSKLAEEIVLWSSFEFGLIEVDDSFATGSSIMPQKKNPIVAELVRGRTGRVYGALMQILTAVKGITMGYSSDLQEDKPPLWNALNEVLSIVSIMRQHLHSMKFNNQRAIELSWANFSTATELANYLVSERHISFRQSHQIVGKIVNKLVKRGINLSDFSSVSNQLKAEGINVRIEVLQRIVDPLQVIMTQTSEGGTSPESVQKILIVLRDQVETHQKIWQEEAFRNQQAISNTKEIAQVFVKGADIKDILDYRGGAL